MRAAGREFPNFRGDGVRMELDLKKVAEFVRKADDEALMDRVTVYRNGMEPAALDLMHHELDRRGITGDDLIDHFQKRRAAGFLLADGTVLRCSFCDCPAVVRGRGWYRIFFGRVPVFPRVYSYCEHHLLSEKGQTWQPPAEPDAAGGVS
jgi:hypothetical protein